MIRSGVNIPGCLELVDTPQSLKPGRVDQVGFCTLFSFYQTLAGKSYIPVNGIFYNIKAFTGIKQGFLPLGNHGQP